MRPPLFLPPQLGALKRLISVTNALSALVSCGFVTSTKNVEELMRVASKIDALRSNSFASSSSSPVPFNDTGLNNRVAPGGVPGDAYCFSVNEYLFSLLHFLEKVAIKNVLKSSLLPEVLQLVALAVNVQVRRSNAAWAVIEAIMHSNKQTACICVKGFLDIFSGNADSNNGRVTATSPALSLKRVSDKAATVRGAIYCLGMALWGSRRLDSLRIFWGSALESLARLVEHNNNESSGSSNSININI